MTDFRTWFRDTTGTRITATDIADILGLSRTSITRRLTGDELSTDEIIILTRHYGVSPLRALVDLDRISDQEVWAYLEADGQLVETAEDGTLALELARRLTYTPSEKAQIDDLAAHRRRKTTPTVSPTTYRDGMPEDAVADSSDEMGGTPDDFEP